MIVAGDTFIAADDPTNHTLTGSYVKDYEFNANTSGTYRFNMSYFGYGTNTVYCDVKINGVSAGIFTGNLS